MGRFLAILFLLAIAIGAYLWLAGGAWARIKDAAAGYQNPVAGYLESQKGKPVSFTPAAMAPAVPQVNADGTTVWVEGGSGTAGSDADAKRIERAKEFGQQSPLRGEVSFAAAGAPHGAGSADPDSEYVTITASATATAPVDLAGWSLESAVTGRVIPLPSGTAVLRLGAVPALSDITLAPGGSAIIASGVSPVGISFQENECSGYLAQFRDFVPSLSNRCPTPQSELPDTLDNLQMYGASCVDYVATLPSCSYHLDSFPAGLSDACRSFVTGALSYNGCIDRHQWDSGFAGTAWRVYLGSAQPLWNPSHDVIRLLDPSGRTVDVLSY
ncbi:MAG TPA: hypothetical protein VFL98_03640 [Candidatus Paceibacterota bacterium]|nr:hypothetical protein [Candidatus Paceibacterota bacterium]